MSENFRAQSVYGCVLPGFSRHVAVETRNIVVDMVAQARPIAISLFPFGGVIKRLGIAIVGIDETRKNHSPEKRQLTSAAVGLPGKAIRREPLRNRRDFLAPNRIEHRKRLPQPRIERGLANAIGHSGVMAGYRMGDNFGDAAVGGMRGHGDDLLRAGGCMIDALASLQSALKRQCVFTEIMQKAREGGGAFGAKCRAETGGQRRDPLQMAGEPLPTGLIFVVWKGMRIPMHNSQRVGGYNTETNKAALEGE